MWNTKRFRNAVKKVVNGDVYWAGCDSGVGDNDDGSVKWRLLVVRYGDGGAKQLLHRKFFRCDMRYKFHVFDSSLERLGFRKIELLSSFRHCDSSTLVKLVETCVAT